MKILITEQQSNSILIDVANKLVSNLNELGIGKYYSFITSNPRITL